MLIAVTTPGGEQRMLELVKVTSNAECPVLRIRFRDGNDESVGKGVVLNPTETAAMLAGIKVLMRGLL